MAMNRAWNTFWVIWQKWIFEIDAQGQKCQNGCGYFFAKEPFWYFCSCPSISKFHLGKWLLVEYYETSLIYSCKKSVSVLVQGRLCPYPGGYVESFQGSLVGFQTFFLFFITQMIPEGLGLELKWLYSFGILTSKITLC